MAISYALIAWLLLQIGDVVLDPLGAPDWTMRALIILVIAGFPAALLLAWFYELTPQGVERDTLPVGSARPRVHGFRRYADAAIIGVLLLTVIFLLLRQSDWITSENNPPVIGVLPFTTLGAEATAADDAWFGTGLADTLSYKLGLLKQLTVLAPSSTFEFRGQGQDLKVVGAKLGATTLLEGTVRRAGSTLRINARLVEIATGKQLWAGSFDRSSSDLFAVQDEIAGAVTDALQIVLSPEDESRLVQPMTTSLTAYDAYLKAQALLAARDWDKMLPAVNHFREATRLDPNYALAWSGLAYGLSFAGIYNPASFDWSEVGDEARSAAARAKALDPNLGDAYLAEALVAMSDNDAGAGVKWPNEMIVGLLLRARELNPNNANIPYIQAQVANTSEERIALLEQAAQLDPQSGITLVLIARQYIDDGLVEKGLEWAFKAAAVEHPPISLVFDILVNTNLFSLGHLSEAARWALAYQERAPKEFYAYVARVTTLNELGAWDEAETVLNDLPRIDGPYANWDIWTVVALAHGARTARAGGDLAKAGSLSQRFVSEIMQPAGLWPDVGNAPEAFLPILDIWALGDLRSGRAAEALERYRLAYPDPELMGFTNNLSDPLRTPIIYAVLHRLTGDSETADLLLHESLDHLRDAPITGVEGIGFTRFFIYAFLGETNRAIDALQEAVDAGWLVGWWGLQSGDFDPAFSRVIADPRFVTLFTEIESRVSQMRADFFAHPGLPENP